MSDAFSSSDRVNEHKERWFPITWDPAVPPGVVLFEDAAGRTIGTIRGIDTTATMKDRIREAHHDPSGIFHCARVGMQGPSRLLYYQNQYGAFEAADTVESSPYSLLWRHTRLSDQQLGER